MFKNKQKTLEMKSVKFWLKEITRQMTQFTINEMCKETNKITKVCLYPNSHTLKKYTFMNDTREIV